MDETKKETKIRTGSIKGVSNGKGEDNKCGLY